MNATVQRAGVTPRIRIRPALALGCAAVVCFVTAAPAQTPGAASPPPAAQSEQEASAQPTPPAGAAASRPDGFFGRMGRWIDESIERASRAWRGKPEPAPSEVGNVGAGLLPNPNIVTGHERCETAANGAPDCRAAAEALCRAKGLAAAGSLDVQSVEKCPARAWISGTRTARDECRTESYVQRAFCR
jgi:hypothetical protein